jgi:predicted alpha/beta superfamily hydrolase
MVLGKRKKRSATSWRITLSWEKKRGGRQYYYKSQRVEGKPVKIYVGSGNKGAEAERQDQERRLQQQRDKQHWETILFQVDQATRHTTELASFVTLLHKALLLSCGYYLHKGHEWRKRKTL